MTQSELSARIELALFLTICSLVISIVPTLMWLQVRLGFSQYDAATRKAQTGAANSTVPDQLVFLHPETIQRTTQYHGEHTSDIAIDVREKDLHTTTIGRNKNVVVISPTSSESPSSSVTGV